MTTQFTGTQIKGVESIWPSVDDGDGDGLDSTEGDEDEHQTAVVFPGTPGSHSELSYVLNVPQPGEKCDTADGDQDMAVLDFDDAEATLQIHTNTHTGAMPHVCKFCDADFMTSGDLARHVRSLHTPEKSHKCNECNYASEELSKLKKHMRCHTGERPYQCPHCTYASPNDFSLKRHLLIHTGEKPYCCDICDARFRQSNTLKAHKLTHNVADRPGFQCELCPRTCTRESDLRVHVRKLHTSDKLLNCKRCGKQFRDKYSYNVHIKTHDGEKCYKCCLCPYEAISSRLLNSHLLLHTDEKPYKCSQCDKSFRQKQLQKRHENVYHNPTYMPPAPKEKTHECSECGSTFCRKGNLTRHMALHDPESFVREKQLALKLGRQTKIQILDGQQVELELIAGFECDDELEDDVVVDEDNVMSKEGADVEQQVVYDDVENLSELLSSNIGNIDDFMNASIDMETLFRFDVDDDDQDGEGMNGNALTALLRNVDCL